MRWLPRTFAVSARRLAVLGAVAAVGVAAGAGVAGAQVLPPGADGAARDCEGEVPVVVASDEAAQSDLYSAATLANVLSTSCIVLADPGDAVTVRPQHCANI